VFDDPPICVFPETEIVQAARLMRDRRVSALPVGNADDILGIVTERDIVTRHVAEDRRSQLVGSIMTPLPRSRGRGTRPHLSIAAGAVRHPQAERRAVVPSF
jgi:CBS domain-containing protein